MSCNLCRTDCRYCESDVVITGLPRLEERTGDYYLVADAECSVCKTKYAAWLGSRTRNPPLDPDGPLHFDLSFRSTFNDEPSEDDLPPLRPTVYRVVVLGNAPIDFLAAAAQGQHWIERD